MWTEDELPDADLESVYGREALFARTRATILRLEASFHAHTRRMDDLWQEFEQRRDAPPPTR